jgi:hypothetical protein
VAPTTSTCDSTIFFHTWRAGSKLVTWLYLKMFSMVLVTWSSGSI